MAQERPTSAETPLVRGLGRVPSPADLRDRRFTAAARFGAAVAEPTRRHRRWYADTTRHFDQGAVGSCTMWSAARLVAAGPVTQRPYTYQGGAPPFDPLAAYCRAQQLDGEARTYCSHRHDTGATMRSAAQVLREQGWIGNFWWLRSIDEVLAYLTNVGPVWMGTWWYSGMFQPDASGFLRLTGSKVGGHAYLLTEIAWRGRYVWMDNSWGLGWAHRNRAKISFDDLAALMSDWGEALAVTEVRKGG